MIGSPRETEVFNLMIQGFSNKEIADVLCISEPTVKWHITSLFTKNEVSTRLELVVKHYEKVINGYQMQLSKIDSDRTVSAASSEC